MYPKLTIEFNTKNVSNTRILYKTSTAQANVAHPNYVIIQGNENVSKKGFQLSSSRSAVVSPLSSAYTYFGSEGYPGFLSRTLSPYNSEIAFYIMNEIPTNLFIQFDGASGEYATSFMLECDRTGAYVAVNNNTQILVSVPITSLNLVVGDSVTLIITGWSSVHKSAKITYIGSAVHKFEMFGSQLIDFRCSENLMDSQLSVAPGVCEQYADITVYDKGQVLHNRAKAGMLETDAKITLSAVSDVEEVVLGTYFVSDWDINSNSSTVKINCRDKSYMFSKINIPRSSIADRTVDELLSSLFEYAANTSWSYLDAATRSRCRSINIPDSWWLASDLHTMLNKICAVGMLRIYWYIDKFYVGRCV